MADEFDDTWWPVVAKPISGPRAVPLAPRLVARLYSVADEPLRARMLACLLRPLGPLGVVAVASGAFASFLARAAPSGAALDDAVRFSREQVFELARFADQVNPEVLSQLSRLLADSPLGVAAFSAAALTLLVRAVQHSRGSPIRGRVIASRVGQTGREAGG